MKDGLPPSTQILRREICKPARLKQVKVIIKKDSLYRYIYISVPQNFTNIACLLLKRLEKKAMQKDNNKNHSDNQLHHFFLYLPFQKFSYTLCVYFYENRFIWYNLISNLLFFTYCIMNSFRYQHINEYMYSYTVMCKDSMVTTPRFPKEPVSICLLIASMGIY